GLTVIIRHVQVNFMVLANFASQLANGSPVLAGVFRGVRLERFPGRLEPFFIAMEIEVDPHEAGTHTFDLRLIDEDGDVFYENQIEAQFDQRPDYLSSYMYFCGQVFVERPIPKAGVYRFDLVREGSTLSQVRMEVSD